MKEKNTLLIIDDDKDLLRQLEFLLEDDFKEIFLASSKEKALELTIEKIDVCLLDVRLSETDEFNTDGIELAKALREKKTDIIITMMSRYNTEKYQSLNKNEYHADAFIRKPFTMDEFIALVNKIKEERNARPITH